MMIVAVQSVLLEISMAMGYADLLIGACGLSSGNSKGRSYVVFGGQWSG